MISCYIGRIPELYFFAMTLNKHAYFMLVKQDVNLQ